jgi:carboxymethylenebutenolidase
MCDDETERDAELHARRTTLSRRELGLGAGSAAVALVAGCAPSASPPQGTALPAPPPPPASASLAARAAPRHPTSSRMVEVTTPEGSAEAFFVAPSTGKHPGVILWPDVAGLRDAYRTMSTRLAGEGYAVLSMNPYYRSTRLPVLKDFAEWRTEAGKARITPMREALKPEGIAKDGAAFAAWLDRQSEVDTAKKLASSGYCMGGPFTFYTAAAVPQRLGAIASFHGGGLAIDAPTSPHSLFAKFKAAALICIAQNDDEKDPEAKAKLAAAAEAAKVPAEIEVYPAQHGWCTIDSPVYDEAQAERAWRRMLAMFERSL